MTESDEGGYVSIPRLEGWLTFPEAGELLGVTKQMVHKLVFKSKVFDLRTDLRTVGDRPIYIVKEEKVRALKERRGNLE